MICAYRCLPLPVLQRLACLADEQGVEPHDLVRLAVEIMLDAERECEPCTVVWHGALRRPGTGTKGELLDARETERS